jgi:acetyltransferase-like isoleucine patch superfamily enzyme
MSNNTVAKTAIIHPNVELGDNVVIEDFCIIGIPVVGLPNLKTRIDDNALIRSGTYIYAGNHIGKNFKTGNKVNIRESNVIGDNASIGSLSNIEHNIKIGNEVRLHSQVFVPEFTILEDGCWLGPNVVITNAKYPLIQDAKNELKGAHIKRGAKIGANTTILPGLIIGAGSLVGAGAIVTRDIDNHVIAYGNPAKKIRKIHY